MPTTYSPGVFTGELIDAAVNNIPSAFSNAAGSRITGLRSYAHSSFTRLQIINTTSAMISFVTSNNEDGIPSNTGKRARCPASYSITFDAGAGRTLILDNLYFQSESGAAITTGLIILNLW